MNRKILINLGSGHGASRLPALFADWRDLRIDIDPTTEPDLVASLTDLGAIEPDTADAVWVSHALEHLYRHEVAPALAEMRRIVKLDGIVCIRVPDLQTVAGYIAADRMHERLYDSSAGPVTAHDVVFGYGPEVERGRTAMAHRTGFTPTLLVQSLEQAGFASFVVRRQPNLELVALARKGAWADDDEPGRIFDALGL